MIKVLFLIVGLFSLAVIRGFAFPRPSFARSRFRPAAYPSSTTTKLIFIPNIVSWSVSNYTR